MAREMTGGHKSHYYDCAACEKDAVDGRYGGNLKAVLGHDGPPLRTFYFKSVIPGEDERENERGEMEEVVFPECPVRTLLRAREANPVLMQEIDAVRSTYAPGFRRNQLPVSGGLGDQPARTMNLIEAHEQMNERAKAAYQKIRASEGET